MSVVVSDPFGAAADPKLVWLARALRPDEAGRLIEQACPELGGVRLRSIRVTRHKPGRRCLVEYEGVAGHAGAVCLIGKVRAKGADRDAWALLDALTRAGFGADSTDGVRVPPPAGVVPELGMWLQHKVAGVPATALLGEAGGPALARRVAEAIHKLHRVGLTPSRRHTMADEMAVLEARLADVARERPAWAGRLRRLLAACRRLAASTPEPPPAGVHRDFYPDQVLVDGPRLYLLDFDLFCAGDRGLDAGNFLGHLTEQAVRTTGRPDALADCEAALEERFVELSGPQSRPGVRAYAALTLVRHIFLSTQFPERRAFTPALLELCERRVAAVAPRVSVGGFS